MSKFKVGDKVKIDNSKLSVEHKFNEEYYTLDSYWNWNIIYTEYGPVNFTEDCLVLYEELKG
jgi:hypothetical protein